MRGAPVPSRSCPVLLGRIQWAEISSNESTRNHHLYRDPRSALMSLIEHTRSSLKNETIPQRDWEGTIRAEGGTCQMCGSYERCEIINDSLEDGFSRVPSNTRPSNIASYKSRRPFGDRRSAPLLERPFPGRRPRRLPPPDAVPAHI